MYLWEQKKWPLFIWDEQSLAKLLVNVSREQGRLLGKMEALGFELCEEANLRTLTEDVLKTSEREGEDLAENQVKSSIARRLGLDIAGLVPADKHVDGVVDMMLDATGNYEALLTEKRLFKWHKNLFPIAKSGMHKIRVGRWRDDVNRPMQVVSGSIGREKIHYQAPPADRIASEMSQFLKWFEQEKNIDPLLFAGLAHLWFITIHPFDDGNGRIARAIADMALARSEKMGQRFYSMSAQIRRDNKAYYNELEMTQKNDMDITQWQHWFLTCLLNAIDGAQETLSSILIKSRFWERFAKEPFN